MNGDPGRCAGSPCTAMSRGNELQTPQTETAKEGLMSSQKTTYQNEEQGSNAPLKEKEQQCGTDSIEDSLGSKGQKTTGTQNTAKEEKRKLAMLSVFDGVSTAALAMQEFLDLTEWDTE